MKRRCGRPAVGQCVYCMATFCDDHGILGEDHHEVCQRQRCSARYRDLFAHREWVTRQHQRNIAGYCAADDCEEALEVSCERCHLRFCLPHVHPRTVTEMGSQGRVTLSQMLCPHCTARRRLWE